MRSGVEKLSAPPAGAYRVDGEIWVVRVTIFCVLCILTVGLLDVLFYFLELLPSELLRRSFDIAREESLGTWVSISLSLLTGLTAGAVCAHLTIRGALKPAIGWAIVALFFVYVTFDDAAKFHERLGTAVRLKYEYWTDSSLESWFPSWGWQLFVAPLFVGMGIYLLYFLWTAVSSSLRLLLIAGFGLFGIAVAMDFVEGILFLDGDKALHLMRLVEEMLEMFGTTVFLYVFLSTLSGYLTLYIAVAPPESSGER